MAPQVPETERKLASASDLVDCCCRHCGADSCSKSPHRLVSSAPVGRMHSVNATRAERGKDDLPLRRARAHKAYLEKRQKHLLVSWYYFQTLLFRIASCTWRSRRICETLCRAAQRMSSSYQHEGSFRLKCEAYQARRRNLRHQWDSQQGRYRPAALALPQTFARSSNQCEVPGYCSTLACPFGPV